MDDGANVVALRFDQDGEILELDHRVVFSVEARTIHRPDIGIGGTLVIERGSGSGWVRHRARAANPDQPARDGNAASQPPEDTDAMCIGPNALSSLSLERLNEVQR